MGGGGRRWFLAAYSPSGHSVLVTTNRRGCEYCADDANMLYGHVVQVASHEMAGTLLLRCPRCNSWYEQDAASGETSRRGDDYVAANFPGVL
jgi:hypothetical protein